MKNKILSLLLIPVLLFTGCEEPEKQVVEIKKEITNKYSEQVQEYNFFLDKYKFVTNYYFVLDYEQEYKVDRQTYHEYEIGDYYTITKIV